MKHPFTLLPMAILVFGLALPGAPVQAQTSPASGPRTGLHRSRHQPRDHQDRRPHLGHPGHLHQPADPWPQL